MPHAGFLRTGAWAEGAAISPPQSSGPQPDNPGPREGKNRMPFPREPSVQHTVGALWCLVWSGARKVPVLAGVGGEPVGPQMGSSLLSGPQHFPN